MDGWMKGGKGGRQRVKEGGGLKGRRKGEAGSRQDSENLGKYSENVSGAMCILMVNTVWIDRIRGGRQRRIPLLQDLSPAFLSLLRSEAALVG